MKKLLSLISMIGLVAAIVSCSSDDGGGIETIIDTVTTTITDTVTNTVTECTGIECITVVVDADIDADRTWSADSIYELAGRIAVLDGATLTISAGTIVKGQAGTGANASALLVARGGTLNAVGTATAPIIMTSVADNLVPSDVAGGTFVSNLDQSINGLWGGLIVLGNAAISASDDDGQLTELQIEGIPTTDSNGLYGGSANDDNSGTISYVSIRHGGSNIGSGNEINGLTLGGVGTGTTITDIEVVANQDDGIEWFGGAVNVDNVVVWNCFDDSMDSDQDWTGTCSDFIIVTPQGGSAFELDGPEGTNVKDSDHTFNNGIVYAGDNIDHLVDWDDNTNAILTNIFFYGIADGYSTDGSGVESFGGDAPDDSSSDWEYILAEDVDQPDDEDELVPATATELLSAGGAAIGTVRTAVGDRGVATGVDGDLFPWTMAEETGGLSSIGL